MVPNTAGVRVEVNAADPVVNAVELNEVGFPGEKTLAVHSQASYGATNCSPLAGELDRRIRERGARKAPQAPKQPVVANAVRVFVPTGLLRNSHQRFKSVTSHKGPHDRESYSHAILRHGIARPSCRLKAPPPHAT
jgi:hypothetical protein